MRLRSAPNSRRGRAGAAEPQRLGGAAGGAQGRVYAVDGNAYFSRPGPRIVDSLELLAELIHPELCAGWGPRDAWQPLANAQLRMIEIH